MQDPNVLDVSVVIQSLQYRLLICKQLRNVQQPVSYHFQLQIPPNIGDNHPVTKNINYKPEKY